MIPLTSLWLPILLSAVFVFIASNIMWMALPFWHRADYGKLPDDKPLLDSLSSVKSGQYMAPCGDWGKLTPEEREAQMARPMAFILVRNPARFSFGATLGKYFLFLLFVSALVAYIPAVALEPGTHYLEVFRVVGTAAILVYAFSGISDSIWYGKPWSVTAKVVVDGIIYGLLTAGTFGWLWPR
jgi:hypothetical protein